MSLEKHIRLTATSEVSWKDAIVQAVSEASKTIDYLSNITVLDQKAKINGKKIIQYYVDLDLAFTVDTTRGH